MDWPAVGLFCLVAFGSAWLIQGALAVTGGLARPWAAPVMMAMMFTPALASWVTCRFVTHQAWAAAVGMSRAQLRSGGWRRVALLGLAAVAAVLVISVLVIASATWLGWLPFDRGLPGLDATLGQIPADKRPPRQVLLAAQLVNIPIAACTINGLLALGEEIGWRGWLLGALWPLGRARASALVGAVWGLWHAPLIAMGYEYNHRVPFLVGVLLFTAFAVVLGICLAWLRMRSGSVLAAAVGHGAVNAVPTLPLLFVARPEDFRWALASLIGVPGVVLLGLTALALLVRGRWRPRPARPDASSGAVVQP